MFSVYRRLLQLLLQCAHTSVQLADDTVLYVICGPHVLFYNAPLATENHPGQQQRHHQHLLGLPPIWTLKRC